MSDDPCADSSIPRPGDQHRLLKPFAGTFRSTVRLWLGPGDPVVHHGTMVNSLQLDDLFLFQDYTGDPSPGPFPAFRGKGFRGFNITSKEFEGFWIDNASTMMQMERGQVDDTGKVWTMRSEFFHPHHNAMVRKRTVIRLLDDNRNDMTTWMTGPDGNEVRSMEILFERA